MVRRSHPQDYAGEPPPDRRCTATVRGKRKSVGQRCSQWAVRGSDLCTAHQPGARSPSHNPPPERRCRGKSIDADGHHTQPCKLWAIRGLTVCYRHGGSNRFMRAAGARRVAEDKVEQRARRLALRMDVVPVENPLEAIAQHIGEETRFKDALRTLVENLEEIRFTDERGTEQLRSEIAVYERALGRVGDRLVQYARLGIDERLVAIEEKKAAMVIAAINAVIDFYGGTPQQAAEARRIASRHLKVAS